MTDLTRANLIASVKDGSIFKVEFTKRDGSERHMTCRLGVKKHLKGGTKPYSDKAHNILTVFEMVPGKTDAYRSIRVHTIHALVINGERYEFEPEMQS